MQRKKGLIRLYQTFIFLMVEATGFEPTTFASRTRRATSCATPRFFNFLSIFVSGQTCGQATYFERFVEKYTARIVRFFKGFSDFQKSLLQDRWRCPERCALPAALRLEFFCLIFLFEVTGRLAVPKRCYARAPPRQVATNCATPRYSPFRYALQNVLDRKRIYYSKYGADCQIFLLPSGKYLENYFKRGRA